jgi:hypothetical protein
MRCFFCLLLICFSHLLNGQVNFDATFENGRLDTAYADSGTLVLAPITNLHVRVFNAQNQTPTFKIYDSLGYQLRPYHHMVYRYAADSVWHFFDTAYKATSFDYYHFKNHSAFSQDTIYVAYWHPYTYTDLQQYVSKISGHAFLQQLGVKGHSYQGRHLYGYQITDTNYAACYKQNVVITARQHPTEHINGYFIEGFTNYLLYGQDSTARFLRRNYHFFIYPMLNPDGVFNGSGQNALGQGLNREWEDSLISGGTPEIDTIRHVIWAETNQKVNWSIDLHANAGSNIPYYWWGYTASSPVAQWQQVAALDFVQAVSSADTSSPSGTTSFQNHIQGNGVNNSLTAANWFRRSFGAIAFTFEPTSEPMGPTGDNAYSIHQFKAAGASIARGFAIVFDTVQALGGFVVADSLNLTVEISGGHPPYTYNWSGPTNGTGDTLFNPSTGSYSVIVTDALGCQWQGSINYTNPSFTISEVSKSRLGVYPNPTRGALNFSYSGPPQRANLNLYSLHGQLIWQTKIHLTDHLTIQLPIGLKGYYMLAIQSESTFLSLPLLVQPN